MSKSLYFHTRRAHTIFENVKVYKPRRAIGQVQKFAGKWIIPGLEITMRESISAFSHSLIVLQIFCYVINLSMFMHYSLAISQVVSLSLSFTHRVLELTSLEGTIYVVEPVTECGIQSSPLVMQVKCSHHTIPAYHSQHVGA